MDIEGAESRVLTRNTAWSRKVKCIKVEVHEPYSVHECVRDLGRLGFATQVDAWHWASVTGIQRGCNLT
jgi:hypothetical protein